MRSRTGTGLDKLNPTGLIWVLRIMGKNKKSSFFSINCLHLQGVYSRILSFRRKIL